MKNRVVSAFLVVTALLLGLTVGFFVGRNVHAEPVQIQLSQKETLRPTQPPATNPTPTLPETSTASTSVSTPTVPQATVSPVPALININTATLEELDTLPGIGPVIGQRILDYREEHGPFASVNELMNVKGIGKKTMEKLLPYITIGG